MIRLNNEKEYSNKRVITKILKLDENNQDDFGMTKPLPTGCIKQNFDMSQGTFNLLLQNISLDDQISNLYVVDIEFDHAKAKEKQLVYNEIYPPIIEKQKIIGPCEKSVYQLLEQNFSTEKGNLQPYRATKILHATLVKKKFKLWIQNNFLFPLTELAGMSIKSIHTIHLNKNALRKISS